MVTTIKMGFEKSKSQKKSPSEEQNDQKQVITKEMIRYFHDCDEIDFTNNIYHELIQEDVEIILSKCGMNLKKLIINEKCDSSIMSFVKKYCRNLKKFEFAFNYINEDDFIDAFIHMKKLKCLIVKSSSLFSKKREEPVDIDKILSSVHDGINELLFLKDNSMIQSDNCLHIFPQTLGRFKNLGHLSLKEYDINDESIMVISSIKSLIILCFDSCTIKEDTEFERLDLPSLKYLTLNSMKNIDDCIINIPIKLENLKFLDINYCKNVSVDALMKIPHMINLKQLYLGACEKLDGDIFVSIVNECKKLEELGIAYCKNIPGDALEKISTLENLEVLDIRETNNINDDVIIGIANNCKKIKDLHIRSCKNVSTFAYNELSQLENLEVLEVVDADNVKSDMFRNMFKLKLLYCTWCPNLTDIGLMRIIKNASDLEHMMICQTGVTCKTLVYALNETNRRQNNIVLKITIDKQLYKDYQNLQCDSGEFIDIVGYTMCCKHC